MSEATAAEREKKVAPPGLGGRRALPPNVSNEEEDDVPTVEFFIPLPRGVALEGMTGFHTV